MLPPSIYLGFDPREADAFAVARMSARRNLNIPVPISGLVLDTLRAKGLYTRPTEKRMSAADRPILWDTISGAPMSTEFAISRFLVPILARGENENGWALFADCDVLFRRNITPLFDYVGANQDYAVMCVKHSYQPKPGDKMDGQPQTAYSRKNWSSVMMFNVGHRANKKLTLELVNSLPGRDLHRFCWLEDSEIGDLGPEYNYLVGESAPIADPKVVHFTLGGPWMAGYENVEYADEWRKQLHEWAA